MKKEGLKSYRFGNKNNWRRWAWNQIKNRVDTPSKEIVLYLADEHDLDRPVALSKGFKHYNLIAVNKDKKICEMLRAQKKIAMHGNLAALLLSWENIQTVQPTVIFADLCGTIDTAFEVMFSSLSSFVQPEVMPKVMILNMLRGREASTGMGSYFIKDIRAHIHTKDTISRARALGTLLYSLVGGYYLQFNNTPKDYSENQKLAIARIMEMKIAPRTFSYKSINGCVMDSIAFSIPEEGFNLVPSKHLLNKYSKNLTRQISANLAVRTMRMNKKY